MSRDEPSPSINPPEPDHRHEDHDFDHGRTGVLDGPGTDDADRVPYAIGTVLLYEVTCRRKHCDATGYRQFYFAVDDYQQHGCQHVPDDPDLAAEWFDTAEQVDYDEIQLTCDECGATTRLTARDEVFDDDSYGACTGEPPR